MTELIKHYAFIQDVYLHLNYVGNNVFLYKIYFVDGVEIVYERHSVAGSNNGSGGIINNVGAVNRHDFLNSLHGLVKKLTKYDVQTSSLVFFCSYFYVYCWYFVFHLLSDIL